MISRPTSVLLLLAASASAQVLPQSQLDQQRTAAKSYEPAALELWPKAPRPTGEPRVVRVRVYASADYRAQSFEWSTRLKRLIDRVNRAAARWPAVRFEVVEVRRWEEESARSSLEKLVETLEKLDPGSDVDCVVGMAAAVPTMPEQIHNLGMARQMGRHFILRSLHDLAEYQVVQQVFDQMSPPERERLVSLRKAHKEVVLFLHEWAHTLGLIHSQNWQRIMNPIYNHGQSLFSDAEVPMVELGIRRPESWREELARLTQREPDPEWDPRDRDQLRSFLSGRPAAEPPRGADHDEIARAVTEANGGKIREAWKRIDTLLDKYPGDVRLQQLGCQLATSHPLPFHIGRLDYVCGQAVALSPDDAAPLLLWAEGERRNHLEARADEMLTRAEALLAKRGSPELWQKAAALRQELDEPTLAVEDARHSKSAAPIEAWATKARRLWLLPPSGDLPPAREGEYVRLVRVALQALEGGQAGVVEMMARQLEGGFPKLPAAPVLRCALQEAKGALDKAERECKEALTRQSDAILTHRLLAKLAARRGQKRAAADHERRAAELEAN